MKNNVYIFVQKHKVGKVFLVTHFVSSKCLKIFLKSLPNSFISGFQGIRVNVLIYSKYFVNLVKKVSVLFFF